MGKTTRVTATVALYASTVLLLALLRQSITAKAERSSSTQQKLWQHFATPHPGELVDALPLTTSVPYTFVPLFSLALNTTGGSTSSSSSSLFSLSEGSLIQVKGQVEATNGNGYNVMFAHYLRLRRASDNATEMIPPAFPAGENITPNMHHSFRSLVGSLVVPADFSNQLLFVEMIGYAASDVAKPGQTLQINVGYGGLTVTVLAP